jgi:hypothetical protein
MTDRYALSEHKKIFDYYSKLIGVWITQRSWIGFAKILINIQKFIQLT